MVRYCWLMTSISGKTAQTCGCARTTNCAVSRAPPRVQVASKRKVSFEKPVAWGTIEVAHVDS